MELPQNNEIDKAKTFFLLSYFFIKKPDKDFVEKLKNLNYFFDEEEILKEYTYLFRGLKEGISLPPPYESLWRGEETVYGNYTIDVLKKYKKYKLKIDFEEELPDHIGIELKAMGLLFYHKNKEYQKEFLEEHILRWVPNYCIEMGKKTRNIFYKDLSSYTIEILKEIYNEA